MDAANDAPRPLTKKQRTRRELLAAAIDAIAAAGEAFTVLEVTRRAGVSNGSFYNHFADRDDLVDAVVDEVVGTFADTSAGAVAHHDPARRFATITALLFEHAAAFPQLATVVLRLETMRRPETSGEVPLRPLGDDLASGFASGRFSSEPGAAVLDLVTGTLLRAVRRIVTDEHDATATHRRQVIALVLRALGIDGGEADEIASIAVREAPRLHRQTLVESGPTDLSRSATGATR